MLPRITFHIDRYLADPIVNLPPSGGQEAEIPSLCSLLYFIQVRCAGVYLACVGWRCRVGFAVEVRVSTFYIEECTAGRKGYMWNSSLKYRMPCKYRNHRPLNLRGLWSIGTKNRIKSDEWIWTYRAIYHPRVRGVAWNLPCWSSAILNKFRSRKYLNTGVKSCRQISYRSSLRPMS